MTETDQVVRAARRAIARAKRLGRREVTPDDLLVGLLREISRFGMAQVGGWAIDIEALDREDEERKVVEQSPATEGPAYAPEAVRLFERAAAVAREDGAAGLGLIHLLVAFADVEDGAMARLRRAHGLSSADWRAALAREDAGLHPPLVPLTSPAEGDGRQGIRQPDLLSVDDAAGLLGVHSQTVRNYIRSGKLPAYRLAGERFIRVLRKDLLALLEPVSTDDAEDAAEIPLPG